MLGPGERTVAVVGPAVPRRSSGLDKLAPVTIRVGVFGAAGRMGQHGLRRRLRRPGHRAGRRRRPAPRGARRPHRHRRRRAGAGLRRRAARRWRTPGSRSSSTSPRPRRPGRTCAGARGNGVHAVVGTTGLTDADYDELRGAFTSSNCVVAPNFAIGAVLMMRLAEIAAPFFESVEVIELHHEPRSTRPRARPCSRSSASPPPPRTGRRTRRPTSWCPGARGGKGPADIPVHSVRLRGLVAHQEVLFGTTGQSLVDPPRLARPLVVHARRAAGREAGRRTGRALTIGLDALLDL